MKNFLKTARDFFKRASLKSAATANLPTNQQPQVKKEQRFVVQHFSLNRKQKREMWRSIEADKQELVRLQKLAFKNPDVYAEASVGLQKTIELKREYLIHSAEHPNRPARVIQNGAERIYVQ